MSTPKHTAATAAAAPEPTRPRPRGMAQETRETRSDEALLAAVANERDRAAFGELYDRYEARAYNLARYLCAGSDAAEDALQNAMLRVWTNAGSFQPGGNPRGWIFRIVAREALRQRARVKRHRAKEVQEPVASDAIDTRAPEARAEKDDELEAVRAHLWKLPAEDRRIVALYYGCGLTQQEIGEALDVGQNTVSRRLTDAIAVLRQALASAGCAAALPLLADDGLARALTGGASAPGGLRERVIENLARAGEDLAQASRRAAGAKAGWGAPLAALLLLAAGAGGWYAWTDSKTQSVDTPKSAMAPDLPSAQAPEAEEGLEDHFWDFSKDGKTEGLRVIAGAWRWVEEKPGDGCMAVDATCDLGLSIKGNPKSVYRFDFRWHLKSLSENMSMGVGWLDAQGRTANAKVWGGLGKSGKGSMAWATLTAYVDGNVLLWVQDGEPMWVYEMYDDDTPRVLGMRLQCICLQTIRVRRIAREEIPADLRDLSSVKRKLSPPPALPAPPAKSPAL